MKNELNYNGNFSKCASYFNGSAEADMDAFIDAVKIYKNRISITDINALHGLLMLLDNFAAKWWQGLKSTVRTWEIAVGLLRSTFGPSKSPHRAYKELCALL